MKEQVLKILYLDISEIKEYENNSKEHPEWQILQIANSIEKFGFNDPIAIDENNTIIEGHGRYLAAKKLGLNKIPCIQLKKLKESERKAYIIAHNKLTMNTGFDLEKLKAELEILKFTNIDLELTGFEKAELEDIMSDKTELNLLPIEDTLDEDNSNKLEGLVCPCCGHKAKKKEFLECDIEG